MVCPCLPAVAVDLYASEMSGFDLTGDSAYPAYESIHIA